jgi:hypothetical protein
MKPLIQRLCLLGGLIALIPSVAAAQGTTGSISGTVTDEQSGVLPGVTILVTQVDTGAERSQISDEHGRYRVLSLSPGPYKIKAELTGFHPVLRDQLIVAIGKDLLVDVLMKVGGVEEQVTVTGETSSVSLGSTTAGGVVTTRQIAELPLNGRSFMQLATLQPGVITSRGTARDFTGGFGSTQLAIGGARPEQTGYLMDGTNIADISDKAPSSLSGVLLGVDTVQEFSVQTHGYSAEFGRAAGGVMSTVTKSGTNRVHGSVFEFHRDDALNTKNYFATGTLPPFQRDQFGGTLGGPIFTNKLFYFGSYEQLRERNAVTQHARLPNALAHQGIVPNAAGALVNVGVNPIVKPYLDLLFPIPDGVDFGDGTAELVHSHQEPTDEYFGVTKFDYNLGKKDTLMVRWSHDNSKTVLSQPHPDFFEHTTTATRYFTTQDQHLFSSNVLNMLRFAANRTGRTRTSARSTSRASRPPVRSRRRRSTTSRTSSRSRTRSPGTRTRMCSRRDSTCRTITSTGLPSPGMAARSASGTSRSSSRSSAAPPPRRTGSPGTFPARTRSGRCGRSTRRSSSRTTGARPIT